MRKKNLFRILIFGVLIMCNIPAFAVLMRLPLCPCDVFRVQKYCPCPPVYSITANNYQNARKQFADNELLNVKDKVAQILEATAKKYDKNARITTTTPPVLTALQMDSFSSPRSSWLTLVDTFNEVSMDIGIADLNNAQTWTLPSNLLNEFESYYNEDFIPVSEVPDDLRFAGANKVVKSEYEDSGGNTIEVFEHYIIGNDAVDYIGISYYYYLDEDEDAFDAEDFKFSDVPMQLANQYSYIHEDDNPEFRNLRYIENTKTVDAFGTLNTPYGAFDCLRMTIISNQYSRLDTNSTFTLDYTLDHVGFVTDQGHYIIANTSGLSGVVNMANIEFRIVAPTGILQDQSEVQINNDGDGVLISNTGVYIDVLTKTADKDAILDLESDDKGIMIPRLTAANRPATPNTGLLIYQVDNTPGFYYYDGTTWTRIDNTTPSSGARIAAPTSQAPRNTYKKGFGKLVNGSAFIPLKSGSEISPEETLIQLQAEGECNGLYISKKTPEGFEVKELNNGKSNTKFSWTLNQ